MPSLFAHILLVVLAAAAQSAMPATGRVAGRVVDATTREPISGAVVTLVSAQVTDGRGTLVPPPPNLPIPRSPLVGQTNFEGTFEIGNVPRGRWRLQVQREGYVLLSGLSATVPIESTDGRVTVPDIAPDRGGTVTGRVLDARGRPVVGVMVLAMRPVTAPDGTARTTGNGSGAETDDLGEFRVPGLAPGRTISSRNRARTFPRRFLAPRRRLRARLTSPRISQASLMLPWPVLLTSSEAARPARSTSRCSPFRRIRCPASSSMPPAGLSQTRGFS